MPNRFYGLAEAGQVCSRGSERPLGCIPIRLYAFIHTIDHPASKRQGDRHWGTEKSFGTSQPSSTTEISDLLTADALACDTSYMLGHSHKDSKPPARF